LGQVADFFPQFSFILNINPGRELIFSAFNDAACFHLS
jgi:hypothetical protein